MAFWSWSKTSSSNASADSTINYSEGQAPSSINDSARAAMARLAEYRDDIAGAIVTGGTSTGYTVSSNQGFDTLAHMSGATIAFTPHATNGAGPVTLNVDSLGTKPLRTSPGIDLLAGTLVLGTPYVALYNNADAAFYLCSFFGNPYNVPLGGGMDYWGATVPNSSFAFPIGQQISQTTYAALYTLFGSNRYGTDAGGNFFLPDKTGRVSAMKEASATRLTSTYFGGNSTALGAVGGAESDTLLIANLPPYTPTVASINLNALGNSTNPGGTTSAAHVTGGSADIPVSGSITMNAQGGTSTPIRTVQPSIVCNYIIRII